jgi:hypothetical protein
VFLVSKNLVASCCKEPRSAVRFRLAHPVFERNQKEKTCFRARISKGK